MTEIQRLANKIFHHQCLVFSTTENDIKEITSRKSSYFDWRLSIREAGKLTNLLVKSILAVYIP